MRRIEGWEDYSITEDGRIWSHHIEKFLKLQTSPFGYLKIILYKNGKQKNYLVHRLVALTFIPNPDNKSEVNHIDGNKKNNKIENLEWVTSSENQIHSFTNNLQKVSKGEAHWNSKLTKEDVLYIRNNYKFRDKEFSFVAIAKRLKISPTTVQEAYYGKQWRDVCD